MAEVDRIFSRTTEIADGCSPKCEWAAVNDGNQYKVEYNLNTAVSGNSSKLMFLVCLFVFLFPEEVVIWTVS